MTAIEDIKRIAESVSTFPYHFHNSAHASVEVSPFPLTPIEGFRGFMEFVRQKIK